ncbi:hypothetical protein EYF80_044063 [Liparis tanakae]|uniref:Uncharacterized protein n=1 Tax=Liparis tanakae TaxID=230148 RepID=A0A4Z2FYH7_9TELE|nr:hypothetical protein EYF80_044063 [Liparis tanakae]
MKASSCPAAITPVKGIHASPVSSQDSRNGVELWILRSSTPECLPPSSSSYWSDQSSSLTTPWTRVLEERDLLSRGAFNGSSVCWYPQEVDHQLGGFGHAHQRWPEGAAVKLVAHFGHDGDSARVLARHGGVEERLVLIGVKLLAVGVEFDQAVLGEHLLDLDLGHHQPVVQVLQVRVLGGHLLLGHAVCGLFQDVGHLQQVLTQALDP